MVIDNSTFHNFLKTEATIKSYTRWVTQFYKFSGLDQDSNPKKIESEIIEYVNQLKSEGKAAKSIHLVLSALQFYFSMHDVVLNWVKLKKLIPRMEKPAGSNTWKDQDIREMIKVAGSIRNRALIYFLTSTGVRLGAIPGIKLKHITKIKSCKAITVYANDPEEYTVFLTPEASAYFDSYLKHREDNGERLNDESPAFVSIFRNKIKVATYEALGHIVDRIVRSIPGDTRTNQDGGRYTVQRAHGFRKWYATKIKLNSAVSWSVSERLLGHRSDLDASYFQGTIDELFKEFEKVIPDLTIDQTQAKELKIRELEQGADKIAALEKQVKILTNALGLMEKNQ